MKGDKLYGQAAIDAATEALGLLVILVIAACALAGGFCLGLVLW